MQNIIDENQFFEDSFDHVELEFFHQPLNSQEELEAIDDRLGRERFQIVGVANKEPQEPIIRLTLL